MNLTIISKKQINPEIPLEICSFRSMYSNTLNFPIRNAITKMSMYGDIIKFFIRSITLSKETAFCKIPILRRTIPIPNTYSLIWRFSFKKEENKSKNGNTTKNRKYCRTYHHSPLYPPSPKNRARRSFLLSKGTPPPKNSYRYKNDCHKPQL